MQLENKPHKTNKQTKQHCGEKIQAEGFLFVCFAFYNPQVFCFKKNAQAGNIRLLSTGQ